MTVTHERPDAIADIPEVSIAVPDDNDWGHLAELRTDPVALLDRVHAECGEIGRFRLVDKDVVMVTGAEVNEQFFKAPDSTLDQAAAYPFMTPIFGQGVVFDASPEERQQALKNQATRCAVTPPRSSTRSTGWSPRGATRARSTCSTSSPS